MELTERPDRRRLRESATHPDVCAYDRKGLNCLLKAQDEDEGVRVKYTRKPSWGRFTANFVKSAVAMWKPVRSSCFRDRDIDVDIKNAHPCIAAELCRQLKVDAPNIIAYANDRDRVLTDRGGVTFGWGKKVYIAVLNGANVHALKEGKFGDNNKAFFTEYPDWRPNSFWVAIFEEAAILSATVKANYKDFFDHHGIPADDREPWAIFQFVETEHLLAAKAETERRGIGWSAYCYDGFQVPKQHTPAINTWIAEGCPVIATADQLTGDWASVLKFIIKKWPEPLPEHPWSFDYDKFRSLAHMEDGETPSKVHFRCKAYFEAFFGFLDNGILFETQGPNKYIEHRDNGRKIATLSGIRVPFTDERGKVCYRPWLEQWKYLKPRRYVNFTYLPPYCEPDPSKAAYLDRWNGWDIQSVMPDGKDYTSETKVLHDHLFYLAENCQEGYNYVVRILAHYFQRPGRPTQAALVFIGDEGTGKSGFFGKLLRAMMGKDKAMVTENADDVLGQKCQFHKRALKHFLGVDEISGLDTHGKAQSLWKSILTEETVTENKKFLPTVEYPATANYMFFSNSIGNVCFTGRRIAIFQTGSPHDAAYYRRLFSLIDLTSATYNGQVLRAFYDELMAIDLTGFDCQRDKYISETYRNLERANKGIVEQWIEYARATKKWTGSKSSARLWKSFECWCMSELAQSPPSISRQSFNTQLGNLVAKGISGIKKHDGQFECKGKMVRGYDFDEAWCTNVLRSKSVV